MKKHQLIIALSLSGRDTIILAKIGNKLSKGLINFKDSTINLPLIKIILNLPKVVEKTK